MKLNELAAESGVSTTTLKHWIRVGILPAGRLRNRTTAVYEQRHVDRARLIVVLRDLYGASTAAIRSLTDVIDSDVPTLEVMNACQAFALGISEDAASDADHEVFRERTHELMRRRDWRGYPGAAEQGLALALAQASAAGNSSAICTPCSTRPEAAALGSGRGRRLREVGRRDAAINRRADGCRRMREAAHRDELSSAGVDGEQHLPGDLVTRPVRPEGGDVDAGVSGISSPCHARGLRVDLSKVLVVRSPSSDGP